MSAAALRFVEKEYRNLGASLAFLICSLGIAGLFFLNRNASVRNSKALWLPVIWLWIVGSRPVSVWLGTGASAGQGGLDATLDGSPLDAAIFAALLTAGLIVLLGRRRKTGALLRSSAPLIVYFTYCMVSITWSEFPGPAFKRWIKDLGDLVMVLIVVTDLQPVEAVRRIISRVGFVLLPLSVVLTRYTVLGRGYDPGGNPMNTGVTTNKNTLGLITFVLALGAFWNVRTLILGKQAPDRGRRLMAQGALLAFGLVVLQMAHSATSVACFVLGAGLILATNLRAIRSRPARVHVLCLSIVLVGGLTMLLGGEGDVVHALGRSSDLTGRTEIWAAAIPAVPNILIGAGFESFWNSRGELVAQKLAGYWNIRNLVSAHNGYIQIYLDLGWVGVALISLLIISGYRRACAAFQRNFELGSLALAYIATSAVYSFSEVGFRVLTPSWIFLLLAVALANGAVAGIVANGMGEASVSRSEPELGQPTSRKLTLSQSR